jgi:hypothetical protein
VLLKVDVTSLLGVSLLSNHFNGDCLAKQDQTTADVSQLAVLQFNVFPLVIPSATAFMPLWHLESIGIAFHFCFRSPRFETSR